MIVAPVAAEVKPAAEVIILLAAVADAFATPICDPLESDLTDADWDRMAEEAAERDMIESGLCPF
jgi:hypothetical protein